MSSKTTLDVKKFLEAGAHFGHKTSRWHPKMSKFIHSKKDGIHIIDLFKTTKQLEKALNFIEKVSSEGKQVLLVGTKRQATQIISEVANETKMPYVTQRWLGGTLTNKDTIGSRIKYLKDLETKMESGLLADKYSKLEVLKYQEEIDDMNVKYGGIKSIDQKVGVMFLTDIKQDNIALKEAVKTKVPVVAVVDTNTDPTDVDYPIPANDDSIKTLELICEYIKNAIISGKNKFVKSTEKVDKQDDNSKDKK